MIIDVASGLPSTPCVWRLLPERGIGYGFTSAPLAVHTMHHLLSSGACTAVADMANGGRALGGLAELAQPSRRPSYVRVTVTSKTAREQLMAAALGCKGGGGRLASLGSPFAGRLAPRGGFTVCESPPSSREGYCQIWLSFGDDGSTCACHVDEPNGLLVVLGGRKRVALLHPAAPAALKLPTRGPTKLDGSYNALEDPRFTPGGEWEGVMHVVTLSAGLAVYIPRGWWHQIHSTPDCVALSLPVRASVDFH